MRSVTLFALALALLVWAPARQVAQNAPKPLILRVRPFTGDGLSPGEAGAAQSLVTSYIVEFKAFRVIDAEGQELALKEAETAVQLGVPKDISPLAADYILSANAQAAGGLIVFTMDLTKVSSGEKRNVAKASTSVNDLILSLRGLTSSLFDKAQPAQALAPGASPAPVLGAQAPQGQPPAQGSPGPQAAGPLAAPSPAVQAAAPAFLASPSLAALAGTWGGDKGVDRISLFRDGRGMAILSSGNSMKVKASISGSSVIIVQDQPSSAEFYKSAGMDLKTARAVAAQARPWRWVFSLTEDRATLIGTKESVFVKMDAKGAVSVDNNFIREARWTRLFQ
jgi:hypothetical protein